MKYHLVISSDKKNLQKARIFLQKILEEWHISPIDSNQVVLVLDEVLANLMIHSLKENETKNIDIFVQIQEEYLLLDIYDYNSPYFDIAAHQDIALETLKRQKRKGGMGLTLVKTIMDLVEVYREGTTNIWHLEKKFPHFLLFKNIADKNN